MKEKYKLRLWVKLFILITLITVSTIVAYSHKPHETKKTKAKEIIVKKEKVVYEPLNEVSEGVTNGLLEVANEEDEEIQVSDTYTTRMTSYYPEEGETMTASGLGINNFGINSNGWFTYDGKLVIATASTRLGYTNMRTYNLYDELIVNINGVDYDAIVLDVCGACQRDNRIDLFASSVIYAKDTQVIVKIK